MSRVYMFLCSLAVLAAVAVLTGCPAGDDTASPTSVEDSHDGHDHDGHDHDGHDHDAHDDDDGHNHAADDDHAGHDHAKQTEAAPTIKEALAQLSDEDRGAAEAQKICPVTGSPLGSMGKPCKVAVTTAAGKERTVFLCCAGCETAIKGDPEKFLAKLDK